MRRWLLLWVCATAGGITPTTALGQDVATSANEATTPEYDAFIEQAIQAYDNGRWAEARTLFRRAHELTPTARTLRTIGMCSYNLGDYLDAVATLEAALADTRKPLSPEQRAHASDLIARSQAHVGRFRLRLTPEDAVVWVDGRSPLRLDSGEVLLEPGRHELSVHATGYETNRSTLQVEGGDRTTLEFRLQPAAAAPAVATTHEAPAPLPAPATVQHSHTQAVLGYVALGVAGASLVGFAVSTGLASAKASDLEEHCADNACGPEYHDDVDSYDTLKLISTATLIGTGVFAVTGTLLLLTQPADPSERAQLLIGPGSIGVRGRL